jgi:hypothetical protein
MLQSWLSSPGDPAVRQAFKWAIATEVISFLAGVLTKAIQGLQRSPRQFPISEADLIDIASIQWDLIFLGFGTLVGSFLATPKSRRDPTVLFWPFAYMTASLFTIAIIYAVWPWIGSPWSRVLLTNTLGLANIYYCVTRAAKTRKT